MSDYCGIHWERGKATLRRYSTASGAKCTVPKIELEVRDPFELSHLVHNLEEALRPPTPEIPNDEPPRSRSIHRLTGGHLALPAPLPRLTNGSGE